MTTILRDRSDEIDGEQFHTRTCICGVLDCSQIDDDIRINHKIPSNPKTFWKDALYGFEKFKHLRRGTATVKDVEKSSLGLKGWTLYGKRIKISDRKKKAIVTKDRHVIKIIQKSHCVRLSDLYIRRANQDDYKKRVELLGEHDKLKAELMFKVSEYNLSFLDAGGNRVVTYSNSQRHSLIRLTTTIQDLSNRLKTIVSKIINLQSRRSCHKKLHGLYNKPQPFKSEHKLDTKKCNIIEISGIADCHSGLNGTYIRGSEVDSNGYHRYRYVSNGGKYGSYSEVFLYRSKNMWLIGCLASIPKGRGWICLKHIDYDEWKIRFSDYSFSRNKWISISKKQQINPTNPLTLWFSYNSVSKKWEPKINIISQGKQDSKGDTIPAIPSTRIIVTDRHVDEPFQFGSARLVDPSPVVQNITMNIQSAAPVQVPDPTVYDPTHFCQSWATCCEENLKLQPKETISKRVTRSMTASKRSS